MTSTRTKQRTPLLGHASLEATPPNLRYRDEAHVIGAVEKSGTGNAVLRIGTKTTGTDYWIGGLAHVVLTPDERETLIAALIDQRPGDPLIIATVIEGDMLDENGELDHEWTLYRAGYLILTCPHPECLSHAFYEVDRSERWNELMVEGDGLHVHQGDGEYETIGWRCQACGGMCDLPFELASEVSWS